MGSLFNEVTNRTMKKEIYENKMGTLFNEVTNRTILTKEFRKIIWGHSSMR